MPRLPHPCLIVVCLAGSLLQLSFCCAVEHILENEYDSTPPTEYDYNATFDYNFYSNSSIEDLESFIRERESEYEKENKSISSTEDLESFIRERESENQEENLSTDQPFVESTTISANKAMRGSLFKICVDGLNLADTGALFKFEPLTKVKNELTHLVNV